MRYTTDFKEGDIVFCSRDFIFGEVVNIDNPKLCKYPLVVMFKTGSDDKTIVIVRYTLEGKFLVGDRYASLHHKSATSFNTLGDLLYIKYFYKKRERSYEYRNGKWVLERDYKNKCWLSNLWYDIKNMVGL